MTDENKNKCPYGAIYLVPWADKIHICCGGHARGLKALGDVMDSPLQIRTLPVSQPCEMNDDLPEELRPKP